MATTKRSDSSFRRRSSGFTKTYNWERMDALAKVVDFEAELKPSEVAEILIEETLRDPGAVEIGYKEGCAGRLGCRNSPPPMASPV
jgi:hypothetical protein